MKKYEVTDIAHPQYPWLHRIRALRDFADIKAGTLGGYVQDEDNLSQDGTCWIYNDAIAMEEAHVAEGGQLFGKAVARGQCLVSGTAQVIDNATVEDCAIFIAGFACENCHICGFAELRANAVNKLVPLVMGDSLVYGTVSGKVYITGNAVLLPGTKLENPTMDAICLNDNEITVERDYNRCINSAGLEMEPTQKTGRDQTPKQKGECL